jgi:hypothetical protein
MAPAIADCLIAISRDDDRRAIDPPAKNKSHFNKISARSAVHASTKLKPIPAIRALQECATK